VNKENVLKLPILGPDVRESFCFQRSYLLWRQLIKAPQSIVILLFLSYGYELSVSDPRDGLSNPHSKLTPMQLTLGLVKKYSSLFKMALDD